MNRQEQISQILLWEQTAAACRARAANLRDAMHTEAVAEYREQGTAPTWRLPDIGTVSLPVSQDAVYVADEQKLLEWASVQHHGEVETIYRIRPAFLAALLATVEWVRLEDDTLLVFDRDGVAIPGLSVRTGGQPLPLSFRPSVAARQVATVAAQKLVDELAETLGGPVVIEDGGTSA